MRKMLFGVLMLALQADGAVDIDVGRQLFVDDVLIEKLDGVNRFWNRPIKIEDPIIWPGDGAAVGPSPSKKGVGEQANLCSANEGGLWWDPILKRFRLWYQIDWCATAAYAESPDGINWTYPDLDIIPGTNRILKDADIDTYCVVPDYAAENPYASWKLHVSSPYTPPARPPVTPDHLWTSTDGVHFTPLGLAGRSGDRSTVYYDPFRGVWVFSLRSFWHKRSRRYFASREFGGPDCRWSYPDDKAAPASHQGLVEPEKWLLATNGVRRQLYSFNAVAYESLMLGVMQILYNTPKDNSDCLKVGLPKQTGLHFCFSRDGKTYKPRVDADIAPEGWGSGKWDSGYLSCICGICVIKDERLWFYYSGVRGDGERTEDRVNHWDRNGMYSNGSIGAATLRRDGFAGMVADAKGEILTKPVVFSGKHLFVNAECRFGSLSAEIVDESGKVIDGFSRDDCTLFARKDSTKSQLRFKGGDLGALAGKSVRIRFYLHCATLYSFWVSPSQRGESMGYVAGGGPAYPGLRDIPR